MEQQKLCCLVNPVKGCVYCKQRLCSDCIRYVGKRKPCTDRATKFANNGHWVRYIWGKYERQPMSGMFR